MIRQFPGATRGIALPMVLVAALLVESLTLVALRAAIVQVRLAADERARIEGQLIVSSALATARAAFRADFDSLADGSVVSWPEVSRPDGWSWHAEAARTGSLIRLVATALHRSSDGAVFAARRASLLLARDTADTVRVLGSRSRF